MYFFLFPSRISKEEALQWIGIPSILTSSGSCVFSLFSALAVFTPVNLISSLSGPAPFFPSIHLSTSYLPFKTKLALIPHHLSTPSTPQINGWAEKEEPAVLGLILKLDHSLARWQQGLCLWVKWILKASGMLQLGNDQGSHLWWPGMDYITEEYNAFCGIFGICEMWRK